MHKSQGGIERNKSKMAVVDRIVAKRIQYGGKWNKRHATVNNNDCARYTRNYPETVFTIANRATNDKRKLCFYRFLIYVRR